MKFKVRKGFKMYIGADAADRATVHGPGAVLDGRSFELTHEQVNVLRMRGQLGALIPADREADAAFGATEPLPEPVIVPFCPADATRENRIN